MQSANSRRQALHFCLPAMVIRVFIPFHALCVPRHPSYAMRNTHPLSGQKRNTYYLNATWQALMFEDICRRQSDSMFCSSPSCLKAAQSVPFVRFQRTAACFSTVIIIEALLIVQSGAVDEPRQKQPKSYLPVGKDLRVSKTLIASLRRLPEQGRLGAAVDR